MAATRYAASVFAIGAALVSFWLLLMPLPRMSGESLYAAAAAAAARPNATAAPPTPTPAIRRSDLIEKIASMREMHSLMSDAGSSEAVTALLPDSDQLMHDGLAMMHALKPGLPANESGALGPTDLTPAQIESVQDFLDLMDALIDLKGDRDSAIQAPWTRPSNPTSATGGARKLIT